MSLELFLCSSATTGLRVSMYDLCNERWLAEPGIRVRLLTPMKVGVSSANFQRERRIYADSHADGPIYLLADDDCLLQSHDSIPSLVALLDRNPDFAMLSLYPSPATIHPWTPEGYVAALTDDIMEHTSVGGIRLVRKGILEHWPAATGPGYDATHCQAIRDAGYRVGYARKLSCLHLGEGYSTVWT